MAIRNDDGRAELAARLDQLYGIVDELPLPGLNEAERVDILQSVASEMEEEYSPFARLGRAETKGNAGTGLGACDPARIGGGYSFESIVMGREEYMRVGAALAEAVRDVDADVFDMEDELADCAAFAMVGRGYLKPGADREEAFMADPGLHASFADAWEKARYLQAGFPLLGGLRSVYPAGDGEGDSEKSVPETKPRTGPRERPAERKGFVARHRKAIGAVFAASAMFAGVGYFAYNSWQDGVKSQQRVDQLKSFGGDDSTARSFNAANGQRFVGPDNRFNSSVRDIYVVSVANPLLANNIDMYGRVGVHGPWPLAYYAAGHLGTSYLPDGKDQVACMARLIDGVDDIEKEAPKILKAYSLDAKTLLYDMGIGAGNEAAAWGGVRSVATYMIGLIRNGTITTNGLDGDDLRRLVMPIALANMDIRTGSQSEYNLATFLKNTTPDKELGGLTPLQWQGMVLNQIKAGQGNPNEMKLYEVIKKNGNKTSSDFGWPGAANAYRQEIKDLPEKDDICFVYWGRQFFGVGEAHGPHYAAIVGMHFGTPVKVRTVNYSGNSTGTHDDACIWSNSLHRYVGPFMQYSEMEKEYVDSPKGMNLVETAVDGQSVKVTG